MLFCVALAQQLFCNVDGSPPTEALPSTGLCGMENRAFEVTALDATPLELGPKDFSAVRPAGDAQYVGHSTSGQFWESRDCGEVPAGFMQTYRVPRLQDGSLGRTSAAAAQAAPEPDDAAAEDPTPSRYHNSRIWYPPVRKRAFYDNAVRLYEDA